MDTRGSPVETNMNCQFYTHHDKSITKKPFYAKPIEEENHDLNIRIGGKYLFESSYMNLTEYFQYKDQCEVWHTVKDAAQPNVDLFASLIALAKLIKKTNDGINKPKFSKIHKRTKSTLPALSVSVRPQSTSLYPTPPSLIPINSNGFVKQHTTVSKTGIDTHSSKISNKSIDESLECNEVQPRYQTKPFEVDILSTTSEVLYPCEVAVITSSGSLKTQATKLSDGVLSKSSPLFKSSTASSKRLSTPSDLINNQSDVDCISSKAKSSLRDNKTTATPSQVMVSATSSNDATLETSSDNGSKFNNGRKEVSEYLEKRKRNNLAARKSRKERRDKEIHSLILAKECESENKELVAMLKKLNEQNQELEFRLQSYSKAKSPIITV